MERSLVNSHTSFKINPFLSFAQQDEAGVNPWFATGSSTKPTTRVEKEIKITNSTFPRPQHWGAQDGNCTPSSSTGTGNSAQHTCPIPHWSQLPTAQAKHRLPAKCILMRCYGPMCNFFQLPCHLLDTYFFKKLRLKKKAPLSTPRLFRAGASKGLLQKEIANNWKEGNPLKQNIMDWGYTGKTLEQETKTLTKKAWREEFSSWAGFPPTALAGGTEPIPGNTWSSGQISEVCAPQQGRDGCRTLLAQLCSTEPPLQRYSPPGTQPALPASSWAAQCIS